ncbi:hypothetical protein [Cohnella silvisoli]|uniref:Uncharacterized protein n=1 Tax=Cohnella silvisoli TaxID=2873699 RepID=A0ABV1KYQ9_9BACL|nr:hypothetical protein [Cohnella silvisoli]MCD9024329.1 hypothetical protein [Cohnella silvisoli]
MEDHLERPHEYPNHRQPFRPHSSIAISLAIVSLCFVIFLYLDRIKLEKEVAQLSEFVESTKKDVIFTKKYREALLYFSKLSWLQFIQHSAEGGLVQTDDFIVEKLHLLLNPEDEKFEVIIDLKPTPQMSAHYKGRGVFDLPDNEMRIKSKEIIAMTKEFYKRASVGFQSPKWDDKSISLIIEGYLNIGEMKNGKFKLEGEK